MRDNARPLPPFSRNGPSTGPLPIPDSVVAILYRRARGESYVSIGRSYHLTASRIQQIIRHNLRRIRFLFHELPVLEYPEFSPIMALLRVAYPDLPATIQTKPVVDDQPGVKELWRASGRSRGDLHRQVNQEVSLGRNYQRMLDTLNPLILHHVARPSALVQEPFEDTLLYFFRLPPPFGD